MGYAAVISAYYAIMMHPAFFSRPLAVFPLLVLLSLLLMASSSDALPAVIAALMFHVSLAAVPCSLFMVSIPPEDAAALYGRCIQDSSMRENGSGYRLEVSMVSDRDGNLFSACGSIYVVAPPSDLSYGDSVMARGRLDGSIFIASSSLLIERGRLSDIRRAAVGWVRERFRPMGEAGELSLRLLLGIGERSGFALSEDARLSGLSHILALSGMHLSIIASVISPPLEAMLGRRRAMAAESAALFLFSFLAGWRPSLSRALIFRILMRCRLGTGISFVLSYIILLALFPEAAMDLGGAYSFISLGGIFILSGRIDRTLRLFLPLPPAFSASAASSIAALLLSIPLTLEVFGSYQLGAIITTFPVSAAMTLYMVVSLAVLAFPPLSVLLDPLFCAVSWMFRMSAIFPELHGYGGYMAFVFAAAILIAAGSFAGRRREGKVMQEWEKDVYS